MIPAHPGAIAWLGPFLPPVAAGTAFAAAAGYVARQASMVGAQGVGGSVGDRSALFLTVGTAIIVVATTAITTLGPKLIDLLVQAKVKLAAAEAGTAQARVAELEAEIADLRKELEKTKLDASGSVADLVVQRGLNDTMTGTYRTLLESHHRLQESYEALQKDHRIALELATKTSNVAEAALAAGAGSDAPIRVTIAPESEPVSVREVDGGS